MKSIIIYQDATLKIQEIDFERYYLVDKVNRNKIGYYGKVAIIKIMTELRAKHETSSQGYN